MNCFPKWSVFAVLLSSCWSLVAADARGRQLDDTGGRPPNIIVFYTDDHGHADLSCQGVVDDIRTPHVDALAAMGARVVHGYSTAPQCVPSRGGLMIGKFQSRFGLESNNSSLDGFNREVTIAERLKDAGYVTAQFGKWHLGPTPEIVKHGFDYSFAQNAQRPFSSNLTIDGQDRPMGQMKPQRYHVDGCSEAAAGLIRRYRDQPLFLYIAYRAPHVPLDAPKKYLDRFPGEMPERRRQALAMLSAVDDGVGLVMKTIQSCGLSEQTLVFYIGDNGAPLKIHRADMPGGGPGWDGSLNDPLNGEKGMLTEGGIHVPFVVAWPGTIRPGQQYGHPVSALDVAATACALAGVKTGPNDLDGINLIPYLDGTENVGPQRDLTWRWISQAAIRRGKWKLLRGGTREYLFDLDRDLEEKQNLLGKHPDVASELRAALTAWTDSLDPKGLAVGPMSETWNSYYDFYLDGKPAPPLRSKFSPREGQREKGSVQGWIVRNGSITQKAGRLLVGAKSGKQVNSPFLARNGLAVKGPVVATLRLQSDSGGGAAIAWRAKGQSDFSADNRVPFKLTAGDKTHDYRIELPVSGDLIHLRLHLPGEQAALAAFDLKGADGKMLRLWQ